MRLENQDHGLKPMQRRADDVFMIAAKMFEAKGFDATSMSEVAHEVGLTKAGLYYYIKSKNDLLFRILIKAMDYVEESVVAPCQEEQDAESKLRKLVTLHLESIMRHGGALTVLFGDAKKLPPPQLREVRARQQAYFDFVCDVLEQLRDEGRLRCKELDYPASLLMLNIEAVARWQSRDRKRDPDRIVEEAVNFILAGIMYDN